MVESFNFALAEADSMDLSTVKGCVGAAAAAAQGSEYAADSM